MQCEAVLYLSEMNSLGSKLITYKKEKTGRVACNQPGVTSLLGRLLRVATRGVCSFVFSDTGHYTKLDGINADSRRATLRDLLLEILNYRCLAVGPSSTRQPWRWTRALTCVSSLRVSYRWLPPLG